VGRLSFELVDVRTAHSAVATAELKANFASCVYLRENTA